MTNSLIKEAIEKRWHTTLVNIAKNDHENKWGNLIYRELANKTEMEWDYIFHLMENYYDFSKSKIRQVTKEGKKGKIWSSEQVIGTRRVKWA